MNNLKLNIKNSTLATEDVFELKNKIGEVLDDIGTDPSILNLQI